MARHRRAFRLVIVNTITVSRLFAGLLAVPVFFSTEARLYLPILVAYLFVSDVVDGKLARWWSAQTRMGGLVDYGVDRLNFYLQIAILIRRGVYILAFLPFFLRDLIYLIVRTYVRRDHIGGSKAPTFISTAAVYAYVLALAFSWSVSRTLNALLALALSVTLVSMCVRAYRLRHVIKAAILEDVSRVHAHD